MQSRPLWYAIVVMATMTACSAKSGGGGSPSTDDGGTVDTPSPTDQVPPQDGMVSAGFSLAVDRWSFTPTAGTSDPPAGTRFVLVHLTIRNESASPAVGLSYSRYSLQTSGAIVVRPHSSSAIVSGSCGDVAVAAGGMASCDVVFAIPTAQQPTRLLYADELMRMASANFPPSTSGTDCTNGASSFSMTSCACIQSMCMTEGMVAGLAQIDQLNRTGASCVTEGCMGSRVCTEPDACFVTPACRDAFLPYIECVGRRCAGQCATP